MTTAAASLGLVFLLALGLAACGGEDADLPYEPWPSVEERTLEPDHAPTPYTAEQIREGCAPGRVSTYRFDEIGKEPYLQTFRFLSGDEVGASFVVEMSDLEGKPLGKPLPGQNTWKGFQGHASYPKADTSITEEYFTVPAGLFRCFHYVVKGEKDGKPLVTETYFARTIPGPPVKMSLILDGRAVTTMTLIRHETAVPKGP